MLYVASWPESRIGAWDALLKARAIENQCYVAAVNRVGEDPGNRYSGHSQILGPRGETLAVCKESKVCVESAALSLGDLQDFRTRFPVLADADRMYDVM